MTMALMPSEYPGQQERRLEAPQVDVGSTLIAGHSSRPTIACTENKNEASNVPVSFSMTSPLSFIEDLNLSWPMESSKGSPPEQVSPMKMPSQLSSEQAVYVSEDNEAQPLFRPGRTFERSGTALTPSTPSLSPRRVPALTHSPSPDAMPARSTSSHGRKTTPGHIKRPCNAFILFRSHAVTTNLIPKEIERDHRNISRIISHMWHSLDDEERKLWEKQAEIEKQRHRELHPDYKYRPSTRRNNALRRCVRRPSSTERQCERIADAILKSCGREGIKRQRTGKARKPFDSCPYELMDRFDDKHPSLGLSPSCVMNLGSSETSHSCMSSPSPTHFNHSTVSDINLGETLHVRRSSSAPPFGHGLDTYCESHPPLMSTVVNDHMSWLLESPLAYASSTASPLPQQNQPAGLSEVTSHARATTPHEFGWQYQPNDAMAATDHLLTLQSSNFVEPFTLEPSVLATPGVMPNLGTSPAFMPPISPRTQTMAFHQMVWPNLPPQAQAQAQAQTPIPTSAATVGSILEQPFSWMEEKTMGSIETKSHEPGVESWDDGVQSLLDFINGTNPM